MVVLKEPLEVIISGGEGDLARPLKAAFGAEGHRVHAPGRAEMDVRKEASVQAYFSTLARVDVLVINAGLTIDGNLAALRTDDFESVVETNLRGAFFCTRAALKLMLAQRSGHILFIGSRTAKAGARGCSIYAAAKAGLVGLAQSLAREYGPRGIRSNVVLPGFLETKMTSGLTAARREEVRAEHVLGRFNTVENAACFIAFLAQLDYASGQVFTLDSRVDRWT